MILLSRHPTVSKLLLTAICSVAIVAPSFAQGPRLVSNIYEEARDPGLLFSWSVQSGDTIFVVGGDGSTGREIVRLQDDRWIPAMDLCPGSCSTFASPIDEISELTRNFTLFQGDLYFTATTPGEDGNVFVDGLWKMAPDGSQPVRITDMSASFPVSLGDRLIFNGPSAGFGRPSLWSWDGETVRQVDADTRREWGWTASGSRAFAADPQFDVSRLYVTDGVSQWQVLELGERIDGIHPFGLDGQVIVSLDSGREIWISDGTASGTRFVDRSDDTRSYFTSTAEHVFFSTDAPDGGRRLWSTDGSENTYLPTYCGIGSSCSGLSQTPVTIPGGVTFFQGEGDPTAPGDTEGLWRTDGTVEGTFRMSDVGPPRSVSFQVPRDLDRAFQRVYFLVDTDDGRELWTATGTESTAKKVTDLPVGTTLVGSVGNRMLLRYPQNNPVGVTVLSVGPDLQPRTLLSETSGGSFFSVSASALDGVGLMSIRRGNERETWLTDGTVTGTRPLDVPGSRDADAIVKDLTVAAGQLFFTATSEPGERLFRSDGQATQAVNVGGIVSPRLLGENGGNAFLQSRNDLWVSDGTSSGTRFLAGLDSSSARAVTLGNRFFVLDRLGGDLVLWESDGTPETTERIVDVPNASSFDDVLVGSGQFFLHHDNAPRFVRSDGSADGTYVVDLSAQGVDFIWQQTLFDDQLVFVDGGSVWSADGTPDGLTRLIDRDAVQSLSPVHSVYAAGDTLYLLEIVASTTGSSGGWGWWASTGTAAGTRPLGSLPCADCAGSPRLTATVGDTLYFVVDGDGAGEELWRVTPTTAPEQVKDICAGSCDSFIESLTVIDERLYFGATDGVHGREPWTSDGTAAGTYRLGDVALGARGSEPKDFTRLRGEIFFSASSLETGNELWAYDLADGGASAYLAEDRFEVTATWSTEDAAGSARMVPFSTDTAFFWFFGPDNIELVVKVLDGTDFNENFWVFYGALSDVAYTVEVRDRLTGETKTYENTPGNICGVNDTGAFPSKARSLGEVPAVSTTLPSSTATKAGTCVPSDQRLCFLDGRFSAEVTWKVGDESGPGQSLPGTDESGYYWFFEPGNVELAVKVLDGRPINGKFWVFYGGLSDVEYTLTVTDTESGDQVSYTNPAGEICGNNDIQAF